VHSRGKTTQKWTLRMKVPRSARAKPQKKHKQVNEQKYQNKQIKTFTFSPQHDRKNQKNRLR
jgi:hypothetical protein